MLSFIGLIISIILYQIFWILFIKDFKLKNISYVISIVLTCIMLVGYWYIYRTISFLLLPYALILLILINLSLIDCKYYEVSGKSYWFLLLPSLVIPILNYQIFFQYIISFIIYFVLFWIIDKIVGIEKIGGADVKILLVLAPTIVFWDCFTLIALSFLFDTILFLIKFPIDKIRKKTGKTQIPMIVAITIAWTLICFINVVT